MHTRAHLARCAIAEDGGRGSRAHVGDRVVSIKKRGGGSEGARGRRKVSIVRSYLPPRDTAWAEPERRERRTS